MNHFISNLTAVCILGASAVMGCSQRAYSFQNRPEIALQSKIGVIDPRVEIMFAVQILAGYDETGLISEFDTQYQRAMRKHFAPFEDHSAVQLFKKRMYEGFNFSAPHEFMLCHDSLERMKPLRPYSKSLVKHIGGEDMAEQFRLAMLDFAKASKASDFFREQQGVYQSITSRAHQDLGLLNLIQFMEQYTGVPLPQAGIIFMPLGHQGGFGLHLTGVPGFDQAISLIGPTSVDQDIPVYRGDDATKLLILHELAHPIVNPLLDQREREIDRSATAFKPVQERLKAEACGDWASCAKETIVRAIVIQLAAKHLGANAALKQRVEDRRRGWVYVDEFLPLFEEFEKAGPATNLKQRMPQIIERFDFIAKSLSESP